MWLRAPFQALARALPPSLTADTRARRFLLALVLYVVCTGVFFASAPRDVLTEHTKFNHYALLADAWLRHRLDLGHPPPAYTQNNDFAPYNGRWYVSFPPFPAVLLLPWAKLAGTPENLRDGQVWLWFAGIGPAVLFLALEKLRRSGRTGDPGSGTRTHWALAATFAFGTVYFFTSLQGTVWFSAHVVAVALLAIYLWSSLDAEHPLLAGTMVGLLFATRPHAACAGILFVCEALRVSLRIRSPGMDVRSPTTTLGRLLAGWHRLDLKAFAKRLTLFALPLALIVGVILWHNWVRFGALLKYGHEELSVGWHARIAKWGLFSYHYLARNLGIVLTGLPFHIPTPPYLQINSHGLALWLTTPVYLWLLWPRMKRSVWYALVATIVPIALADLLYQNSGWLQFGYRFSNDYSVFLFALLAVSGLRFGRLFWACALFGVVVNTFGALTFARSGFDRFYYTDGSQQIIYQPD